jgi:hypothetical protein
MNMTPAEEFYEKKKIENLWKDLKNIFIYHLQKQAMKAFLYGDSDKWTDSEPLIP